MTERRVRTLLDLFNLAWGLDAAGRDRLVTDLRAFFDTSDTARKMGGVSWTLGEFAWSDDGRPGADTVHYKLGPLEIARREFQPKA